MLPAMGFAFLSFYITTICIMVKHASSYRGLSQRSTVISFAIVFRLVSKFVTDEGLFQEFIKARERIPHIGFLPKVIPLKLFLDMVPSSSKDLTRALLGFFRGGFVYVSFLLVSKRRKTFDAVRMSSLIF